MTTVLLTGFEPFGGDSSNPSGDAVRLVAAAWTGPETLVPICVDRSVDMAIGILGILKSGAAYVPVDPLYPAERVQM